MAIKLYKENGLYYFQNRVHPAGTCFLFIEPDGKLTVKNIANGEYIITQAAVTDFVNSAGAPYPDFVTFISIVGEFFSSVSTTTLNANITSVNGKISGSFFGDNMVTTERTPVCANKWSQGLPDYRSKITYTGDGGEWGIVPDTISATKFDGAAYYSTLVGANRGIFFSSATANRYLPGHLSYFGYTWSWHNLANANGTYLALVGAFIRGAASLGLQNSIKEAICWGFVGDVAGVATLELRIYKNYNLVLQKTITDIGINFEHLNIFEHQIGYYGIYPSIIWWFDSLNKTHKLLDYTPFNQAETHVADPNLSVGVYLQNITNTAAISIRNGSLEFGNYSTLVEPTDASARLCIDSITIASIAADPIDTDGSGFLAAYRVTDVFSATSKVNKLGRTVSDFESSIINQLISISGAAISNRTITLNVWFVPAADVTATFTAINPRENILEKATTATVNFANGKIIARFPITANSNLVDVSQFRYFLSAGTVAVLSLVASQATTVTDVRILLNTRDLF